MTSGFPDSWFRPTKETPSSPSGDEDNKEDENKEEKEKEEKKERALSATKLIASAIAAVTSAYVCSYLGDSGTLFGVAMASVITGAGTVFYEQTATRMTGRMPTILGKRYHPSFIEVLKQVPHQISMKVAALAIISTAVIAAASLGLITAVEASSGRTLHGIATGQSDHGTTLGGSTSSSLPPPRYRKRVHRHKHRHHLVSPSASPSVSVTPSISIVPTPSSSVSPSSSPSPVPSSFSSTPTPISTFTPTPSSGGTP